MSTIYAAHIVTAEAHGLGESEVIVMTNDRDTGASHPIANYPIADWQDPIDVLRNNGWTVVGGAGEVQTGYLVVDVQAIDHEQVVKHVTYAKELADQESRRQDDAWRMVIADAMNDGGSATRLAAAAGVSRERVYQIRDGRR